MIQALSALFISLASSVPGRVLAALGMGIISYTAVSVAVGTLVDMTISSWNTLPATLYQLASLGGFTDSVGIVTAALTAKAGLASLPRLGVLS